MITKNEKDVLNENKEDGDSATDTIDTKDQYRLLWTTGYQRRNGQASGYIHLLKIKSWRNKIPEHTRNK